MKLVDCDQTHHTVTTVCIMKLAVKNIYILKLLSLLHCNESSHDVKGVPIRMNCEGLPLPIPDPQVAKLVYTCYGDWFAIT